MKINYLSQLAIKDLWFDRKVSFFIIASLLAVIAPLMLLFSLKYGVVSQLQQKLVDDPRNLEIKILGISGNQVLNSQWIEQVRQRPEVDFVIPLLGTLNMQVNLRKSAVENSENIELLPTDIGDPLMRLDNETLKLVRSNGIILSSKIAEELQANKGDRIELWASRILEEQSERIKIPLIVEGILPRSKTGSRVAFTHLDLLTEIDNYKDGFRIAHYVEEPVKRGQILTTSRDRYAKARIYANHLDTVAPLAKWLKSIGIETETQDYAIAQVRQIDSVLTTIFMIIAVTAISGAMLSLSGSFLANIERKRKELSFLRLLGTTKLEIQIYLIIQAVILTFIALSFATVFFGLGSIVINLSLGNLAENEFVSLLTPIHILWTFIAALSLSVLVALYGGKKAMQIQPAESLREA